MQTDRESRENIGISKLRRGQRRSDERCSAGRILRSQRLSFRYPAKWQPAVTHGRVAVEFPDNAAEFGFAARSNRGGCSLGPTRKARLPARLNAADTASRAWRPPAGSMNSAQHPLRQGDQSPGYEAAPTDHRHDHQRTQRICGEFSARGVRRDSAAIRQAVWLIRSNAEDRSWFPSMFDIRNGGATVGREAMKLKKSDFGTRNNLASTIDRRRSNASLNRHCPHSAEPEA